MHEYAESRRTELATPTARKRLTSGLHWFRGPTSRASWILLGLSFACSSPEANKGSGNATQGSIGTSGDNTSSAVSTSMGVTNGTASTTVGSTTGGAGGVANTATSDTGSQISGTSSGGGATSNTTTTSGAGAGGAASTTATATTGDPMSMCPTQPNEADDPPANPQEQRVVDPSKHYQTTEGWGTSLCWFGNVIGGWSDSRRNAVADLLFDEEQGLGLNVMRYNIGGGDAPDHNHMGYGKEMPGFKPTEGGDYDFSADANQRWMLDAAIERVDESELILEAFSNSPPWWMTNSGCASGADGSGNNLKSGYVDDFADYLSEVVLHFRDTWGIHFRTLEPLNEPMVGWGSFGGQEGCHVEQADQPTVLHEVRSALDQKGLTEVELASPDETALDVTVQTYNSFNADTRDLISQINTHAYYGSQRSQLLSLATRDNKRLWSSEIDGSGAPAPFDVYAHNHDDIVPGLDIAQRITRDLREMHVDAWIFWQAVESEQAQTSLNKNWGLLHGDFENGSEQTWMTKKYYTMKQYSSFIRPGFVMIDVDDDDAVAFLNEEKGRLVIVQRHSANSDTVVSYDLSGFGTVGVQAAIYRTSPDENYERLSDMAIVDNRLTVPVKAQSITTFVVDCMAP